MKMFSTPGLYQRDLYVLKTVVSRGVPVATVIGGGYSRDIDKLAVRHSIVHRAAAQVRMGTISANRQKTRKLTGTFLSQVWKECDM